MREVFRDQFLALSMDKEEEEGFVLGTCRYSCVNMWRNGRGFRNQFSSCADLEGEDWR